MQRRLLFPVNTKLPDQFEDIFQEIFDDFTDLQFEFHRNGPGLMSLMSKYIDMNSLDDKYKGKNVRKIAFAYAHRLIPYLQEANDRLGDIGYRCVYDPNQIVRLRSKYPPKFEIVICIYPLDRLSEYRIEKWDTFILK